LYGIVSGNNEICSLIGFGCWFRRHGKLLEEGASGFLQKKLCDETQEPVKNEAEGDWDMFNKIVSDGSGIDATFGSKHWASVYLASTPQQAALMGLKFPGVDEVENIVLILLNAFVLLLHIYVKKNQRGRRNNYWASWY